MTGPSSRARGERDWTIEDEALERFRIGLRHLRDQARRGLDPKVGSGAPGPYGTLEEMVRTITDLLDEDDDGQEHVQDQIQKVEPAGE